MTATTTALVPIRPAFSDAGRLALAGFPAGYRGLTREAYALDLRQFTAWRRARSVPLSAARRAGIEGFARDLQARGRARATVTRRLCTSAGFCTYAVEEDLLEHCQAAHVRRPRADYQSHAVALDRNELGALLVAAGPGPPAGPALISPLALNGLRVSEATGADIEQLGLGRGHRRLTITRKGGKAVTIPLAPRTAQAIDLAAGERTGGPVFVAADGRRRDRHGAGRIVRTAARRAGSPRPSRPARSGTRSSPPRWMRGSRCAMSKRPPRTPIQNDDAVRPGPRQPGPARHLYRRRVYRGRRQVVRTGCLPRLAATAARRGWRTARSQQPNPMAVAVTDGDLKVNANRRSGRIDGYEHPAAHQSRKIVLSPASAGVCGPHGEEGRNLCAQWFTRCCQAEGSCGDWVRW